MSIASGPKIKRDNLILHVDSQNVRNFELGITPNLFDGNYLNIRMSAMRELTFNFVAIENGWYKYSISGTGTSNTYPYSFYIRPMTINANYRISVSFKYKTNVQEKFLSWGDPRMVNIFYKSGFSDFEINYGDYRLQQFENVAPDRTTSNVPLVGDQFQPIYFLSRPVEGAVFNPSTDFLYFKDIIVEQSTTVGVKWFDLKNRNSSLQLVNSTRFNSNQALVFDGVNDYVDVPGTYNIKTAIAVIKIPIAGNTTIVGPFANGQDNWFGMDSNRRMAVLFTESSDVNNTLVYSTSILDLNKFYHVCCTIDTNNVKIYINGNLDNQTTPAFNIGQWNGAINIGRRAGLAQRYFNGEIAYVKLYDTVLTQNEVKQNFEAFRGRYGI